MPDSAVPYAAVAVAAVAAATWLGVALLRLARRQHELELSLAVLLWIVNRSGGRAHRNWYRYQVLRQRVNTSSASLATPRSARRDAYLSRAACQPYDTQTPGGSAAQQRHPDEGETRGQP